MNSLCPTLGKKQTMFGKPANQKMGVLPSTISWLFKSIQEQKQRTGSRFSVRISALTVTGGSGHEVINDLLLPFVNGKWVSALSSPIPVPQFSWISFQKLRNDQFSTRQEAWIGATRQYRGENCTKIRSEK